MTPVFFGWDLPPGVTQQDIDGTDKEFQARKYERDMERADRLRDEELDRKAEETLPISMRHMP